MHVRACVCVHTCPRGQTMTGLHTGRKRIGNAYAFSDVFHSAGCIKLGSGKWLSIYFRQDVRKIDFFPIFSHKTSFTFQLLQLSDAVRPEELSCMDKEKEMYP